MSARRRALAVALAVLTAGAVGAVSGASAASCPTLDYLDAVRQADAALQGTADVRTALERVRAAEALDRNAALFLAPVVVDLTGTPPDTEDARARLGAIDRTLALPGGSTCAVTGADARDALRGVYRSGAFANLDQTSQPGLLDRVAAAAGRFLSSLGGTLGVAGGIALTVLLLAVLAALAAWRVRASAGDRAARLADEELGGRGTDPDAEWVAAQSAAARQDYRQAVRRAFRSALLDAAQRGRLTFDAAWTTRELLASVSADADLLALLAPAAAGFDRAWYSRGVVDEPDWEVMRARCEAMRALASRRRPEPAR